MLVGLCLFAACAPREEALPPGPPRIRLLGRWDASGAPDRLLAVNPGSSFEFRYRGTGCVLHVDRSANKPPLPQLWVELDGAWSKHVVDRDAIVLGEEAPPGIHRVWVVLKAADEHQPRWKPPLVASFSLVGVSLPGGAFLAPPPRRKLILEAVGDSIVEGVLAVRKGKLEEWTEIADARATFAFQAALALRAEPRLIGFGAQGVTRGGNGGVPPASLAYPFVHEGVAAREAQADIVVIHHGGNDGGVPTIENGYRKLIALVRNRNPGAAVFCLVPFPQVHARSIRFAVAAARAEGDSRVYLVETKGWLDPKADTTEGVHPNVQGHAKAATELTAFIRRTMGL